MSDNALTRLKRCGDGYYGSSQFDRDVQTIMADNARLTARIAELDRTEVRHPDVAQPLSSCPQCSGHGRIEGFGQSIRCRLCGGTGEAQPLANPPCADQRPNYFGKCPYCGTKLPGITEHAQQPSSTKGAE